MKSAVAKGKHKMKRFSFALLLCFTPVVVAAAPLRVVNVAAPAINCVFNPSCTVSVQDSSDNIPMSTGGTGFLQSRTFVGAPGAPAPWANVYEYRIDLRNAVGATADLPHRLDEVRLRKVMSTLDFNADSTKTGSGVRDNWRRHRHHRHRFRDPDGK